ncbi:MAG: RnfABCDGE type electron transport complex subunit D [Spirochaetales bacterium]|nr:RnfABCDGE type electron transport complex subunit D [Spirochaetales bacterium]MCF7938720.1 RnfABCDGE type electron transport complex subunit D [Spirochaetales bacterium]
MRRVVYSLIPLLVFSIFLYGFRVLVTTALVLALGILVEFIFEKTRKKKVSEAVLVTSLLFALSLPPSTPFWIAAIGIIFAVFMGKEVFGGFGRNIFNPAISGRLFVYITFPTVLGQAWQAPSGFGMLSGFAGADALTSATPMALLRAGESVDFLNLFLGIRAGAVGESSILLILIAAAYLLITKTANWRLILSTLAGAGILSFLFDITGIKTAVPAEYALMTGSILFVSVFMATDPISAPNKKAAQWIYGFVIGIVSVLIRTFAGFPEGTSFGVFIGNVFASLFDEMVTKKKKPAKKPAPAAAEAKS